MDKKTLGLLAALVVVAAVAFFFWQRGKNGDDGGNQTTPAVAEKAPPVPKRMAGEESKAQLPQPPPPISMDDDPVGSLRLEGQVLDEGDAPVAGATVSISSNPRRETTSEEDGSFVFDKLVGRAYVVNARAGSRIGGPVMHKLTATSDPVVVRIGAGAKVVVTVVAEADQKPVAGASVQLRSDDVLTEIADAEGIAHFEGVRAGLVALVASAPGYGPTHQPLQVPEATTAEVTARIHLRPGAPISGRVVNEKGKPVAGARVIPVDASRLISLESGRLDSVMTNDKGQFHIAAVSAGTFRLAARHGDYAPTDSPPMTTDGSTALTDVELVLKEGGVVTGQVVTKSGEGAAWAAVRVARKDAMSQAFGAVFRQATTDEHGKFEIKGLPREKLAFMAVAEQASSEAVDADFTTAPRVADLRLELTVDGIIAGKVVNPRGEPVAEAQVSALPDVLGQGIPEDLALRGVSAETTDGGGRFEFRGLPDGTYRLRTSRASLSSRSFVQPGTQAATGDTDVVLTLAENGSIEGRLVFEDGAAVEVFTVMVAVPPAIPAANSKGAFTVPDIPLGKYDVTFRGPDFADKLLPGVEVAAGERTDLGTVQVKRGRYATGHVRDSNGQPVAGATVAVARTFRGDGDSVVAGISALAEELLDLRTDLTDEHGAFRVRGLTATRELVIIAEHAERGRSRPEAVPADNSNPTYEMVLLAYGSLAGTVTVGGKPERAAAVMATSKGTPSATVMVTTSEGGSYVVPKLPEGEYSLLAAPASGGRTTTAAAVIRAGKQTRADMEIQVGEITLLVRIEGKDGARVDLAQIFLFKGALAPKNVKEVQEAFLQAAPGGGAATEVAFGTAPAKFTKLVPDSYSVCVMPVTGDVNDPSFRMRIAEHSDIMKIYCSRYTVTETPNEQSYTAISPAMDPLPEPAGESGK